MSIQNTLEKRSGNQCELCSSSEDLNVFEVESDSKLNFAQEIFICKNCESQLISGDLDANHFRCLNDKIWSEVPAIKVISYRVLKKLSSESWAQDLLDMIYLEDDEKEWAEQGSDDDTAPTLDSNGTKLEAGDSVTIIKDLQVKGAGFTAKRGTAVRNISLTNESDQIEGRVNGTRIVLLTKFLKKM